MRAAEESCINNFSNALASLDDMKTVHTDPNLASIRRGMRNVLQHDRSETISEHLTQAFALYGIAQALAFRFEGTMHHEFAKGALRNTSMLFEEVCYFHSVATMYPHARYEVWLSRALVSIPGLGPAGFLDKR